MKPLALDKMTLTLNRKVRGSQTVEELARLQGNVRGSREKIQQPVHEKANTAVTDQSQPSHVWGHSNHVGCLVAGPS